MTSAAAISFSANARFNSGGNPAAIRTRFSTIIFPRLLQTLILPTCSDKFRPSVKPLPT